VKQFVPATMMDMLNNMSSQIPLDTFKVMGYASANIDESNNAVSADK